MAICEQTDFTYPLLADIYYPIVETGAYGNSKKTWVLDKTIACAFNPGGLKNKKDVGTEANINIDNSISGRARTDITKSNTESLYSMTNIIVTNIRDRDGNLIYNESAGPRSGLATLFEVATMNPVVGAFGKTEYYKLILRRSENQAIDL
jgi:hypothetical protein